jgi:glyceraldehyde 3-phosphate dehydrogenase
MVKVGINGFGRIGRLAFRLAFDHPELEFVHINEFPGSGESSAYLAKYDSIHGQWAHGCTFVDGAIEVNDGEKVSRISYSNESTPGAVDWDKHGVELVLECSGQFLTRDALAPFFAKGVKRVLVSAPVKDASEPRAERRVRREPRGLRRREGQDRHRGVVHHELSSRRWCPWCRPRWAGSSAAPSPPSTT